jgi:hypothetical protein
MDGKVMIQHAACDVYLAEDGGWTARIAEAQDFDTVEEAQNVCMEKSLHAARITIHFLAGDVTMAWQP